MKHFLRTIIGFSIIMLTLLVTALSCNKDNSLKPTATLTIGDFGAGVRTNPTDPSKIEIKAEAFSFTPVKHSGPITAALPSLAEAASAATYSLTKAFDIKITGGAAGNPTGGLIMVGTGDKTTIGDFGSTKPMFTTVDANFKEGYTTGEPTNEAKGWDGGVYQRPGWNIYGAFMNDKAPTSAAEAAAGASPFAFTASGGSQPFLFCRSTITKYTSTPTIDYSKDLAGGEMSTCYIGAKGTAFNNIFDADLSPSKAWLAKPASDTFKKTFDIAIGGIRTDGDGFDLIGVGATTSDKTASFSDGLSKAELEDIITRYPYGFRKVSVTIVANDTWTP